MAWRPQHPLSVDTTGHSFPSQNKMFSVIFIYLFIFISYMILYMFQCKPRTSCFLSVSAPFPKAINAHYSALI